MQISKFFLSGPYKIIGYVHFIRSYYIQLKYFFLPCQVNDSVVPDKIVRITSLDIMKFINIDNYASQAKTYHEYFNNKLLTCKKT